MCLGLACDLPASGGVEEHDKRYLSSSSLFMQFS